jgi:predicted lysophospholipase L1 biosynthesis ABC-type transport system permease subunit
MRRIHLAWGILALVAFAVSGQVMLRHVPPMRLLSDDVRLMYRSRHIYLLGSGIANVLLGLYVVPRRNLWQRGMQFAGSLLLLAAPVLLGLAFLAETGHGVDRTWRSTCGLQAMVGGTALHFMAAVRREDAGA